MQFKGFYAKLFCGQIQVTQKLLGLAIAYDKESFEKFVRQVDFVQF